MTTWDNVRRAALALPETSEVVRRDGLTQWWVNGKLFVWERPLRPADLVALGDAAPQGPILGARTPDLNAKQALISSEPAVYFTTPHFDGYPAVLVRLTEITAADLAELINEAWLARAPRRLAQAFLAERAGTAGVTVGAAQPDRAGRPRRPVRRA
ncbi:MAG TPA: MmcQ/YjbR family DNA-binding protein [Candidatus Binatia bacterium]|nr:MmcQ/YjbR family DNA-binding protein [Candidatus Binatia bacterium]